MPLPRAPTLPLAASPHPSRVPRYLRWLSWPAYPFRRRSLKTQIFAVSAAILLPMLAALGSLVYQVEQLRSATVAVNLTNEVIQQGEHLVRLSTEMRLAIHAFALTSDDMFLTDYRQSRSQWPGTMNAALIAATNDSTQYTRLQNVKEAMKNFSARWVERLDRLRPGGDDLTAWAQIGADISGMRRINTTLASFVYDERQAIRHRMLDEDRARRRVYVAAAASSLGAVGLLMVFGLILAQSIATPIQRVASAARRLGEGELDARVTPVGGPETRLLASAFNRMAESLQQAQASLAQRNRELEGLSGRLSTANEDLAERQRETDDFLYVLSHDLRAPLINIQGFSKRLQSNMAALEEGLADASSAEPRKLLTRMTESLHFINLGTAKIDQLIQRLLQIARLSTRSSQRQWIDTMAMVEDVLGSCHFQLEERGIETSIGELPRVFADPVQLNQVFTNLIDNAVKYMGERPQRQIAVDCSAQGERYRFAVRDTGPGIAPKDRDKVFRLFARLIPSASGGEGIGLAAVRAIVNRHGGRTWVESTPDVGSTFYFTLPRNADGVAAPRPEAPPLAPNPETLTLQEEFNDHEHSDVG